MRSKQRSMRLPESRASQLLTGTDARGNVSAGMRFPQG